MIYAYGAAAALMLIGIVMTKKYRASFFAGLDRKDNPLRFIYPLAGKLIDLAGNPEKRGNSRVGFMLKSLYVRENVEKEKYVYSVKKLSAILTAVLAAALFGFMICAADRGVTYVKTLVRDDAGGDTARYSLDADVEGTHETVKIDIDAVKYTEEEILQLFSDSYEKVVESMLAENISREQVNSPLNLISEYGGFSITWSIGDVDIMDYNGTILRYPEEGKTELLELTALFSLDEVSEEFIIPVVIVPKAMTAAEVLQEKVNDSVEQNNDIHEEQVTLPEEIDGKKVVFSEVREDRSLIFMILGFLAAVSVALLYDRTLEEKLKKRQEEMMSDFAEIVSKLSLLYGAGMSIYGAWERTVKDHEAASGKKKRFAYQEMKLTLEEIKSGVSEAEAYVRFGKRCGLHPFVKLGNLLSQNLTRGSGGLALLLKQEVAEAFENRKRLARKKGEEAGTKLLVPMVMMLAIVIAIVAIPAFMSISL